MTNAVLPSAVVNFSQYSAATKLLEWLTEILADCIVLSDTEFNAGYFTAVLEVWDWLSEDDQQILFSEDEREIVSRLRAWIDTREETEGENDHVQSN